MTTEDKKLEILRKVEDGSLTVEEAAARIADLETAEIHTTQEGGAEVSPSEGSNLKHETSGCWKAAWGASVGNSYPGSVIWLPLPRKKRK